VQLRGCEFYGWRNVEVEVAGLALHRRHQFYEHVHAMHVRARPVRRPVHFAFYGFEDFACSIAKIALRLRAHLARV